MRERRDNRGRFTTGNVPRNKRVGSTPREMTSLVVGNVIGGGVLKLERVQVTCPACGQQVEAVAWDGQVKGYCTVAKQSVNFLVETQRVRTGKELTAETKAKISAAHTGKHPTAETKAKISAALRRWHKEKGE